LEQRKIAFPSFFVVSLGSSILFLAVFPNAGFLARILGNTDIVPVIRVLTSLIILDALAIIPAALLKKDLQIPQVSKVAIIAEVMNTVLTVTLAYLGFGYWSLVYGKVSASLIKTVLIWRVCPGWDWITPRRFQWATLRSLFRFGLANTSSGFLSFFNSNWDDWFIGRLMGTQPLGFYTKAYRLTNKSITGFNRRVMSGVFFPSYSKIQDDKPRLTRLYLKTLGMVALVISPVAMGLFAVADVGVPIVLGEKWNPMIPTLQIFAFMALFRSLSGSTSPLFQAMGVPKFNVKVGLLLTAIMVPLVFLFFDLGIAGVALAVTTAHVFGFAFNIYQVNTLLNGIWTKMIQAIMPALFAAGMMILTVQLAEDPLAQIAGGHHNLLTIVTLVGVGAIVYLLAAFLTQRVLIMETVTLMLSVLKRRRLAFNR
jgi:O-antigen/teichoic acid export membrane protein